MAQSTCRSFSKAELPHRVEARAGSFSLSHLCAVAKPPLVTHPFCRRVLPSRSAPRDSLDPGEFLKAGVSEAWQRCATQDFGAESVYIIEANAVRASTGRSSGTLPSMPISTLALTETKLAAAAQGQRGIRLSASATPDGFQVAVFGRTVGQQARVLVSHGA